MAIYVNDHNKITDMFINVNDSRQKITSVWVHGNNAPIKVFGASNVIDNSYDIAPTSAYSHWNYTLDDENNTITLNYYHGNEIDVVVYANYVIDGKIYKTCIPTNLNGKNNIRYNYPYMFNAYPTTPVYLINNKKIQSIKFSPNIDTSNITDASCMFNWCESLISIEFNGINTSNCTNMSNLFASCYALTELDISSFDTKKVTNMESMFSECRALSSINVLHFDTSNVTNMSSMFRGTSLTELDLSSFDTNNVTNISSMFFNSSALKTIYVTNGKWQTSQITSSNMFQMFYGCGTSSVTYK